jgi:hypothetical protein
MHAGWFVDPAPHRHRRLPLVQLRLALVAGQSFAQQPAATLEHPDRLHTGKPQQIIGQPSEPILAGVVETFGRLSKRVDMTRRHRPRRHRRFETGHRLTHLGTIRHRLGLTRRAPTMTRQHLGGRLRTSLGRQLPAATSDRHIDRIHPPPHPLRQPHHTRQPGPITTGDIDSQQPGDRLADTTILHHPTPCRTNSHEGEAGTRHPKHGVLHST